MCTYQTQTVCKKSFGNERAFTLIEILVVCLLISIILAVGIPVFHNALSTDQLKATSRKIIGTVQGLREEAVRNRQAFTLFIDLDQNRMWYTRDGAKKAQETRKFDNDSVKFPPSVHVVDILCKSVGKRSHGTVELWISPQGYTDTTVFHIADNSKMISVFLSPFLGSVRVVDGYADLENIK